VEDVEQRFKCTVTKSMCKIVDNGSQKPVSNSHLLSAVQAFQESHQSVRISGFKVSFTCNLCPFRAEKAFDIDFDVKRQQSSSDHLSVLIVLTGYTIYRFIIIIFLCNLFMFV